MSLIPPNIQVPLTRSAAWDVLVPDFKLTLPGVMVYPKGGGYEATDGREILIRDTDAASVIQQAANALSSLGGSIYLKAGIYPINQQIIIDTNNALTVFDASEAILKATASIPSIIKIRGFTGTTGKRRIIRLGEIDGNNFAGNCVVFDGISNSLISILYVHHPVNNGVVFDQSNYSNYGNIVFLGDVRICSQAALYINVSHPREFQGNRVFFNRLGQSWWGINIEGGAEINSFNYFNGVVEFNDYIGIQDGSGYNIYDIVADSNTSGDVYVPSTAGLCIFRGALLSPTPIVSGSDITKIRIEPTYPRFGYLTRNKGIATLAAGNTSVVVNHGLAAAPNSIKITPQANVGAPWVSNITATSFTINVAIAPAAAVNFFWEAEV